MERGACCVRVVDEQVRASMVWFECECEWEWEVLYQQDGGRDDEGTRPSFNMELS